MCIDIFLFILLEEQCDLVLATMLNSRPFLAAWDLVLLPTPKKDNAF